MTIDHKYFKNKLEGEKELIEKELEGVGRRNPDIPGDWEVEPPVGAQQEPDENDAADNVEELNNNAAILSTLEKRLSEINTALAKIESGSYGICEIGGEEIEQDRLEANPSATTCKAHMQ